MVRKMETIVDKQIDLKKETNFWSEKIKQDCFMFTIGLTDRELKNRAKNMEKIWENYLNGDNIKLNDILDATYILETDIRSRLQNNENIGYLYLDYIEHTLLKYHYFYNLINNKLHTVNDHLNFWNQHNIDFTILHPHFFDPSQESWINRLQNIGYNFSQLDTSSPMFLSWSKLFCDHLSSFYFDVRQKHPLSTFHPVLLDQIISECEHGSSFLQNIILHSPKSFNSPRSQSPKSPRSQSPKSPRSQSPKSSKSQSLNSPRSQSPKSSKSQSLNSPRSQSPKSSRSAGSPRSPKSSRSSRI